MYARTVGNEHSDYFFPSLRIAQYRHLMTSLRMSWSRNLGDNSERPCYRLEKSNATAASQTFREVAIAFTPRNSTQVDGKKGGFTSLGVSDRRHLAGRKTLIFNDLAVLRLRKAVSFRRVLTSLLSSA